MKIPTTVRNNIARATRKSTTAGAPAALPTKHGQEGSNQDTSTLLRTVPAAERALLGSGESSDPALSTLALAETIAPTGDYDRLLALYRSAVGALCGTPNADCRHARRRVAQVEWIRQHAPCAAPEAAAAHQGGRR